MSDHDIFIRAVTLAVTNITKLAGVFVVLYEILAKASPQPVGMAIAAFMMAGAQLSEDMIISLATRMFGTRPPLPEPEPPKRRTTRTTSKQPTKTRKR